MTTPATPAARTCAFLFAWAAAVAVAPAPCLGIGGEGLRIGDHAPLLETTDTRGATLEFRWPAQGRKVFLFYLFDASTAQGLYGMTVLDRIYRAAHDFGLEAAAVETGGRGEAETSESLGRYRDLYSEPPYPVAIDRGGEVHEAFGAPALPALFLVERHGVIMDRRQEPAESDWGEIAGRVALLLDLPESVLERGPRTGPTAPAAQGDVARPLLFPGEPAPDFDIADIRGEKLSFTWSPGQKGLSIVFFWGDPCRPCIREMLFLDQINRQAADAGLPLRILAVATGGLRSEEVLEILARIGRVYQVPAFSMSVDPDSVIGPVLGWGELPSTFFLDGTGTLLRYEEGFDESLAGEWTDFIALHLPGGQGVISPPR